MRRHLLLLSCIALGGCASFGGKNPSAAAKTEVVIAEGRAPIVNDDIIGARKASLDDAMKNALGRVIGVYVSQESFVSKVLLLEDTVLTRTKGYIQRYAVLKESVEKGFYTTAIKAEIRKDDLRAMLNSPAGLHALTVKVSIDETMDGTPFLLRSAQNALKISLAQAGYTVTESSAADIVITGKASANYVPGADARGFISYQAVLSLTAMRTGSAESVAVAQATEGGSDVTREAAADISLASAGNKAARDLVESIGWVVKEYSVIRLTIINVNSLACLNIILKSLRSLDAVKSCRINAFTGCDAQVDLEAAQGAVFDIARHLEQMPSVKILIKQAKSDGIQALCLFNSDF